MDFTNYNSVSKDAVRYDEGLRLFMTGVFNHMGLGLLITALAGYLCSHGPLMSLLFITDYASGQVMGFTLLGKIMMFAPLVFSFVFSMSLMSLSASMVRILFYLFSVVMGMSLSSIFIVYTEVSIIRTFLVTACTFGAVSLYGYTTKKDLTSFGSFLFMGLVGILIAGLVNIFFQSPGLYFAVSALGVLIFTGLTAYEVQRMKFIYSSNAGLGQDFISKMSIYGAFSLYMSFINLFLSLLRFMGNRKD